MTMTSPRWAYLLLLLALAAGLVLRLHRVADNPQGIHPDEALYGYEGWSIRDTGCDYRQTGCPPLYLQGYSTSWDNRTSVLYPYLYSVIFRFLPMDIMTIRLLSVFIGMSVVLLTFVLGRLLWPTRPSVAGLGALFVALSPVAVGWSRIGHDPISVPFLCLAIAVSVLATRRHPAWWLSAAVWLAIGFYAYQPFKLVGPAVFLLSWWYVRPVWNRRQWTWFLAAAVVGLALAVPFLVNQLVNWSVVQRQFNSMILFRFDYGWAKVLKNVVVYAWQMISNPGLFLSFILPFAIFAVAAMIRAGQRLPKYLAGWVAVAFMPAFITFWPAGSNEMQSRGLGYLGPLELLAAYGLIVVVQRFRTWPNMVARRFSLTLIVVLLAGQVAMAGAMNRTWGQFCCFVLGGMEKAATFVNRPEYTGRSVVVHSFHFMQGVNLLWNMRVHPNMIQQPTTTWASTDRGDPRETQYPSHVGRYTLCNVETCYQPGDGALYIVHESQLPGLPVVATFTLRFFRQSFTWKIVDNSLPVETDVAVPFLVE